LTQIHTSIISLDNITKREAVEKITALSQTEGVDIVVTPNIDHLANLMDRENNKQLFRAYERATIRLCDSRILQKMLRMKNKLIKEVIPGSSLTKFLFEHTLTSVDHVMVIGGSEDVFRKLKELKPELSISHYNPPMGFIESKVEIKKVLSRISSCRPNYLFLAVGSPRQEILAHELKLEGRVDLVCLCIGASILFLVNDTKRAPEWVQTLHMEWFHRMLQDPKRLVRRYFNNLLALPKIYSKL